MQFSLSLAKRTIRTRKYHSRIGELWLMWLARLFVTLTNCLFLNRFRYFLNNKCFEIALKVRLAEEDLYLMPSKNLIGYSFNPTFVEQLKNEEAKKPFFMFRKNDSVQFTRGFYFDIAPTEGIHTHSYTYEVSRFLPAEF